MIRKICIRFVRGNVKIFLVRVVSFLISTFLVLEVFFRVGLPARQYPMSTMDPETGIRNYQSSTGGVFSYGALCLGRYRWRINPQGWNSQFDYFDQSQRDNPMVALIGDSYLEGYWSDLTDHIDVQLHELSRGQVDFYSFGTWGAMLSQYLIISQDVIARYQPDLIVVFLNEDDAKGSLYGEASDLIYCFTVDTLPDGTLQMVPPQRLTSSRLIPIMLKSATLRYLKTNRNLAFLARGAVVDPNANLSEPEDSSPDDEYFDPATVLVTNYLLDQFESLSVPVIFVADGPRAPIYSGEVDPGSFADCSFIEQLCLSRDNIQFINLAPYFVEDWENSHTMFSSEENPHWDGYGNSVVARAIYRDLINAI